MTRLSGRQLWAALRRDRPAQGAAVLLVALAVPYFVPTLEREAFEVWTDLYSGIPVIVLFIALAVVAARWARRRRERTFWHLVTAAMTCWLIASAIDLAWWHELPLGVIVQSDLAGDLAYIGFYLFLVLALEVQPHRRPTGTDRSELRGVQTTGAIVVVFALVTYFILIPVAMNRDAYDTWVPSLLLYATLDAYLVLRLAMLRSIRPGAPWDRVYFWLMLTAAAWCITDSAEALWYAGILPWVGGGTLADLLWFPGFVTLIVALRTPALWRQGVGFGPVDGVSVRAPLAGLWGGPLVLYAAVLPVIHFALYGVDALDPVSRGPRDLLSFAALAALAMLAWHYQRVVERENRRLAADVRALATRLHPHFLFNALTSVTTLLARDPASARDGLQRLGRLLRYTLEEPRGELVHLSEEWRFTEAYLDLERLRLGDRLVVRAELDPQSAPCLVPRFIVQPLVENAVQHAALPRSAGAVIGLSAQLDDETLVITIEDDGPGAEPVAVSGNPGIGLRAVRAQLDAHYGERAHMDIRTGRGAGFRVTMRLPADPE